MTQAIILGAINGLTIGLLAVGIVLVYKANRFINLGHAQLGTLASVLLAKFVLDWGLSWWLAFPLAVLIGIGTGLLTERFIIRPLRARSQAPETLLLVSIGIAQLLLALVFVPSLRPNNEVLSAQGYPLPFDAKVTVGGVVLNADYLLILAVVPLMVIGLGAFLRYSFMGKMIRGAASNPEAARLCGVSIRKVSAVTWGIAGALSAVTAVLLSPSQASFDAAQLGPELLLRALGAAAVGGFISVPAACIGGVGLGVIEQVAQHVTSSGSDATLVLFAAIIAIFVLRAKVINKAAALESPVPADRRPLRIPASVANLFVVRRQRTLLAAVGLFVGLVVPMLPYFNTDARRFQLTLILVYALVGVALTIVVGWAGQVSLGHFALVGIGAFITARLAPHDWSLPAILVVAGAAGAAAMAITGLPAVRLRGLTMAVTTLGLAVVAPTWLFRQNWFGSEAPFGLVVEPAAIANDLGRPFEPGEVYYFGLAVLAIALVAAALLRNSVPGRLVLAVRDNEGAAAAFGITPATVKVAVLAVSGFLAGAGGVIWAEAWRNSAASQFSPALSLSILAVPVIGGLGSLAGAVVGAVAVFAPAFFLTPITEAIFGEFGAQVGFQLALGGLGLVAVLLAYPTGIAGAGQRMWERTLERMAAKRHAVDLVAAEAEVPPPLQTDGITLSFGGLRALDEVAIRVEEAEIVGLIGPNGAGKTTLLNTISGALRADKGTISVFGERVEDLPAEFRAGFGVARSFQNARLFPGLTVAETVQVALSGKQRVGFVSSAVGAPWARALNTRTRREAMEMLERLGLTQWADSLTSDLSTGTRRICDLAAQMATRPKLLLLDEPTAGVAQRECEMFPPLLRRIRDELGCSILIIEHDMPMLMSLCDRIYAMETGRVISEGTPEEVRNDPQVVASYLGTDARAIERSGAKSNGDGTAGNGHKPVRRRGEPVRAGGDR
jgi:ABC-type branched-subunit amino acid transport system ATPase component/ABC-type branched-subunit amino acid transport system permease subunit